LRARVQQARFAEHRADQLHGIRLKQPEEASPEFRGHVETGQNVFATLNAVSQILLHKFSKQSEVPQTTPSPVAIPVEPPTPMPEKRSAPV